MNKSNDHQIKISINTVISQKNLKEIQKIIEFVDKNDIDELYDLENDPGEMFNLINNAKYDVVQTKLRADLEKLKEKYKYNADRDWWLKRQIPH